ENRCQARRDASTLQVLNLYGELRLDLVADLITIQNSCCHDGSPWYEAISRQLPAFLQRRGGIAAYMVECSFAPSGAHSAGATPTQGLRPGLKSSAPSGARLYYCLLPSAFCFLLSAFYFLLSAFRLLPQFPFTKGLDVVCAILVARQQGFSRPDIRHQLRVAGIDDRGIQALRHQQEEQDLVEQLAHGKSKGNVADARADMNAGIPSLDLPGGFHQCFALFRTRADGKHAGINVDIVQEESFRREPIDQVACGRDAIGGRVGRPRLAQAEGDHFGAEVLQERKQRLHARRLIGDGIDHRPLLAKGECAAQRDGICAVQAERGGEGFLHDVHEPRQDLRLLTRQAAIHVQHVRAGIRLLAGDFLEELDVSLLGCFPNLLPGAIDQFADNQHGSKLLLAGPWARFAGLSSCRRCPTRPCDWPRRWCRPGTSRAAGSGCVRISGDRLPPPARPDRSRSRCKAVRGEPRRFRQPSSLRKARYEAPCNTSASSSLRSRGGPEDSPRSSYIPEWLFGRAWKAPAASTTTHDARNSPRPRPHSPSAGR